MVRIGFTWYRIETEDGIREHGNESFSCIESGVFHYLSVLSVSRKELSILELVQFVRRWSHGLTHVCSKTNFQIYFQISFTCQRLRRKHNITLLSTAEWNVMFNIKKVGINFRVCNNLTTVLYLGDIIMKIALTNQPIKQRHNKQISWEANIRSVGYEIRRLLCISLAIYFPPAACIRQNVWLPSSKLNKLHGAQFSLRSW